MVTEHPASVPFSRIGSICGVCLYGVIPAHHSLLLPREKICPSGGTAEVVDDHRWDRRWPSSCTDATFTCQRSGCEIGRGASFDLAGGAYIFDVGCDGVASD